MGKTTRPGTSITDFWPDDTETEIYLEGTHSLSDLMEKAKAKWSSLTLRDIDLSDIEISSEYIHTHCLGHDCFDPNDYTNFIVIQLKLK